MDCSTPTVVSITELPPGALFYCPELGNGALCMAGRWEGKAGYATNVIPLSLSAVSAHRPWVLHPISVDNLSGHAVLIENARIEVALESAMLEGPHTALVSEGAIFIPLQADRFMGRAFIAPEDGRIVHTIGSFPVRFGTWRVVMLDDEPTVLWSSTASGVADNGEDVSVG